jgi:hypothetical protein
VNDHGERRRREARDFRRGEAPDVTEDLRSEQERREAEEARRARKAESEEDTKTHQRRAERSAYLREKLEERARTEREE